MTLPLTPGTSGTLSLNAGVQDPLSLSAGSVGSLSLAQAQSLQMALVGLSGSPIVNVADYRPGVDDDTAFTNAIAALPSSGGSLFVPADTYTKTRLHALKASTLVFGEGYGSIIDGPGFQAVTGCVIQDLYFNGGGNTAVDIKSGTPQSMITVRGCRFVGASIVIELPTDNSAQEHISIVHNTFDSCSHGAISVAKMRDSLIAFNTFGEYAANSFNVLFTGGYRNRIIGNRIKGGTTGIAFVYHKTSSGGGDGTCWGNVIQGNTLVGVAEESITLDDRANQSTTAAQELDTVASKANPTGSVFTVTMSSANWTGQGSPYVGYYVVFTTGSARGLIFPITAQTDATLTLTMTSDAYALISPGDELVVGAPFFGNSITGNFVDTTGGTDGVGAAIMLWGLCYGNTVVGNSCHGKGIWVASHNGVDNTGSVTQPANGRKAPSENNIVVGNVVDGSNSRLASDAEIRLHYVNYGVGADYVSYGNKVAFNQLVKARMVINRHELQPLQEPGTYADSFTSATYGSAGTVHVGNGTPQGNVAAPVGHTYHCLDGGAGTSFYVKESGSGTTGWAAK